MGKKQKKRETVTRVIDGDTIETSRRKISVRLENVNAPERGQKGGAAAKRALEDMVLGKMVTVETKARDPYRRAVATVKLGRKNINNAMKKKLEE